MHFPSPLTLGLFYGISEIVLAITRRSKSEAAECHDRNSLALLWIVIMVCMVAGVSIAAAFPGARLGHYEIRYPIGFAIFVAGILLRWYSIFYLGKFFTVNVAIDKDHKVIDTGPYRFIRHPSYTGAFVAFVGFGICLGNALSFLCLIPIVAAFAWRIHIEERALTEALGAEYADYARRTKRLIPFVY